MSVAILALPGLLLVAGLIAATVFLRRWALRVAEWRSGFAWRGLASFPYIALAFVVAGMAVSAAMIFHTFSAVAPATPANKARLLSNGIATAMNCGGLVALPSILLYFATVVALTIGTGLRRPEKD
jgi:hypothetical protein